MDNRLLNNEEYKKQRQNLRNNMPEPEVMLWSQLKGKQLGGYKFRRQHSLGKYILDFYCPSKQLAIEIDGDSHYQKEAIKYDNSRTDYIASFGIKVIRFTNKDIINNIAGVLEVISKQLQAPPLTPTL